MKNIIALALLTFSVSSFCQPFSYIDSDEVVNKIMRDYSSSDVVKDFIDNIQQRYRVLCSGAITTSYSGTFERASLKTTCKGEARVKGKIVSHVIDMKDGSFKFKAMKEVIKVK